MARQFEHESNRKRVAKKYKKEMAKPRSLRNIDLLAAMSNHANFSIGCYCEGEVRCYRSILKELLVDLEAKLSWFLPIKVIMFLNCLAKNG